MMVRMFVGLLGALCVCHRVHAAPVDTANFSAAREKMVETIQALAKTIPLPSGKEEIDPAILAVMRQVPRHELVPMDVRANAYRDRPLPIGFGQTISQPYIVALMTQLARPAKHHVVLEVGTGSGYGRYTLALGKSGLLDRDH